MRRSSGWKSGGLAVACALVWMGCSPSTKTEVEGVAPESKGAARPGASKPAATSKGPAGSGFFSRPKPVTLAEGTALRVRTTNALSTKTTRSGEPFVASLEEPLMADNKLIAPRGATVRGVVAESDPGGRVDGRARIAVRLTSLETSGGQEVDLATNTLSREARATKAKDATKIGIGSGIGAAIGAIAGGGKGAAIGAATGAGAGTGVVLATRGDPAVLPGETVLQFRLTEPLTVQAK